MGHHQSQTPQAPPLTCALDLSKQVLFQQESHSYWLNDRRVPNVTTILETEGLRRPIRLIHPDVLEHKRGLGQAVHQATHFLDLGQLNWATVDERIEPYLFAWERFKRDWYFEATDLETIVYSRLFNFVGTLDRVGWSKKPGHVRRLLPELKTGDPRAAGASYQTALYLQAWREMHPEDVPYINRGAVWLQPDGNYKWFPYDRPKDTTIALGAVALYHEKAELGLLDLIEPEEA